MLTIIKKGEAKILDAQGNVKPSEKELVEVYGASTDTKPTTINNKGIDNGSVFIEMNTGKLFLFNATGNSWVEFGSSETPSNSNDNSDDR